MVHEGPKPRADVRAQQVERLRKLIEKEGHELDNNTIKERMPWATDYMLAKHRKELGVPCPERSYLSRQDFRDRSVKPGSKFAAIVPVEKAVTADDTWKRREREARIRRRLYKQRERE